MELKIIKNGIVIRFESDDFEEIEKFHLAVDSGALTVERAVEEALCDDADDRFFKSYEEQTNYFLKHDGGAIPVEVDDYTKIEYTLRNGDIKQTKYPKSLNWYHDKTGFDIMSYRVIR